MTTTTSTPAIDHLNREYPLHQPTPNGIRFCIAELDERTGGQDARVLWGPYWEPFHLNHRPGLTDREFLMMLRWAVDTVERHRLDRGEPEGIHDFRFDAQPVRSSTGRPEKLAAGSGTFGRGVRVPDDGLIGAVGGVRSALDQWERRDEPGAGGAVRQTANDAMDGIDGLLRELHKRRAALVTEIRCYDDATAVRVDALLASRRSR